MWFCNNICMKPNFVLLLCTTFIFLCSIDCLSSNWIRLNLAICFNRRDKRHKQGDLRWNNYFLNLRKHYVFSDYAIIIFWLVASAGNYACYNRRKLLPQKKDIGSVIRLFQNGTKIRILCAAFNPIYIPLPQKVTHLVNKNNYHCKTHFLTKNTDLEIPLYFWKQIKMAFFSTFTEWGAGIGWVEKYYAPCEV